MAQSISSTQQELSPLYDKFLQNHAQTYTVFKRFHSKFEGIHAKLRMRDKSQEKFMHYHRKVKKITEEKVVKSRVNRVIVDPDQEEQDK